MFVNVISMTQACWWAGIMDNDGTPLNIFKRGNVTLEQYCRDIIHDHVCPFRGAINLNFLFMDDNVRPHRNTETPNTLEKVDINCIQWLAHYLDLSTIVHT